VSDGLYDYGNYANCKWLIATFGAARITLTFTEFNTESGYDFVTLSSCSDASCGSKTQIIRTSGSMPSPNTFTSTTAFLLVELTSDDSVVKSGFSASWSAELAVRIVVSGYYKCM
jgi:hypothetical protein